MIDLILFSLPIWAVIAGVILYVPFVLGLGVIVGRMFELNDQRVADRAEQRLLELAEECRQDTRARARAERPYAERAMDADGLGSL